MDYTPKTNSLPLKNGGCETTFHFGKAYFQRRTVSFREGTFNESCGLPKKIEFGPFLEYHSFSPILLLTIKLLSLWFLKLLFFRLNSTTNTATEWHNELMNCPWGFSMERHPMGYHQKWTVSFPPTIPCISWVWPPPSNSGKWRFIGIPY